MSAIENIANSAIKNILLRIKNSNGSLLYSGKENIVEYAKSDNSKFYYDSYKRLKGLGQSISVSLNCPENYQKFNGYISMITADEFAFAGGKLGTASYNFLLDNVYTHEWMVLSMYLYSKSSYGFYPITISCSNNGVASLQGDTWISDRDYDGSGSGAGYCDISCKMAARPVIVLKPDTFITGGDGTQTNPYVVS